jgi:hypothetical protein
MLLNEGKFTLRRDPARDVSIQIGIGDVVGQSSSLTQIGTLCYV